MPTVPRYESQQVEQRAIPNVQTVTNAPAETFGGGESAQRMQQAAISVFDTAKKSADQLAYADAHAQLTATQNQLQNFAQSQLGKNSFGIDSKIKSDWDKQVSDVQANLANDEQKQAVARASQSMWLDLDKSVQNHISGQIKKYDTEVTDSVIRTQTDYAAQNYTNTEAINSAIEKQKAALTDHAQRTGASPEWLQNQLLNASSQTHSAVLNQMLANKNDIGAAQYFSNIKDDLTWEDKTRLGKMVQDSSYMGQSQRVVDDIFARKLSLDAGLSEVGKIQDPRLREETETRLMRVNSMRQQADNLRQEKIQTSALNLIDQGKGIDDIDKAQWASLDDNRRKGIMSYLNAKDNTITNMETYYDLKDLAARFPESFQRVNMLDYQNKLSRPDLRRFMDLQTDARALKKDSIDGFLSSHQIVEKSMDEAGIKRKEDRAKFMLQIDQETANQKPKTNDDLLRIVKQKLTSVVTDGGFFGSTTDPLWKVDTSKNKILSVDYKNIPREEVAKITATLVQRGLPVTEKSISETYAQGLRQIYGQ